MTDLTRYDDTIAALFDRFPSVGQTGFTPDAFKPGLERMEQYDAATGHCSSHFRAIHVAGTNGKGSVANMLAAALMKSGHKTGLFTSPHILDFRERILVDGQMIPREAVLDFLDKRLPLCDRLALTFFEICTAMAFEWFSASGCEYAVIETGLGGRLDSTNILPHPEATVITSIGLDHCAILGNTREEIAAEKAGIFKKDCPAIVGEWDEQTGPVFVQAADRVGAPLAFADRLTPEGWADAPLILQRMDLQGPCQDKNLRTVLSTLQVLGIKPGAEVLEGVENAAALMHFHGRWEKIGSNPDIICDIGHNPPALEVNFRRLRQDGRPLAIVYGIMRDKDLSGIMPLMPSEAEYYFCAPRSARALPEGELMAAYAEFCKKSGRDPRRAHCCTSVREALKMALRDAESHTLIYVGGSTYVVAEALACTAAEAAAGEAAATTE